MENTIVLTLTIEGSDTDVFIRYSDDPYQVKAYDKTTEVTHLLRPLQKKYIRDRIARRNEVWNKVGEAINKSAYLAGYSS